MTTFIKKQVECPVCSQITTVTLLTSTNYMGQYSDFHRITAGFAPLPLLMNTCPVCGYSGSVEDFEKPENLTPELKQKILHHIQPIVKNAPLDGGRRYEIFALIQELNGADSWLMGNLYLRAAWAAMDSGSMKEADYRRVAISFFQKALNDNKVPPDQVAPITYLIGELYRRVGERDAATAWFNRVIERARKEADWKPMAEIALRQRDNPQDRF